VRARLAELITDFGNGLVEHSDATTADANERAQRWHELGVRTAGDLLSGNPAASLTKTREEALDFLRAMLDAYVLQGASLIILERFQEFVDIAVDRAFSETTQLMAETFGEAAVVAVLHDGAERAGELVDLEQFRKCVGNQRGGDA
jgi:hypothetical protein